MVTRQAGTRPRGKPRWGGGRYVARRKFCSFCANKAQGIDYKDTSILVRYISDRGKIEPRRRTGTCARHQRALAMAIKRARHIALLPYVPDHIYRMGAVIPLNPALLKTEPAAKPEEPAATAVDPETKPEKQTATATIDPEPEQDKPATPKAEETAT